MSELFLWIVILAPLGAALFGYLFRNGSPLPHLFGVAASFLGSLFLFLSFSKFSSLKIEFGGLSDFPFVVVGNYQNALLALVVSVVALAIFIYAKGYIDDEKGKTWFWPAMSLFLASMQLLVMAGDWFLFITGWELMGLASFLLIGTWHEKKEARRGSVKAFMLTRFADMGLYAGVFLTVIAYGQLAIPFDGADKISLLASSCFLLAVMGKSAQIPFQSWLSGAMAGPTPVSALLHSATMVGAGALLLIKIYPLLSGEALVFTGIIGGITLILTGITAITSKDIKQMLAASTSSQLGFMLLALGAGFPGAAFAHWLAHAFMKSTLFLGAGLFQEGYESTNYDKIGGSGKRFKYTFAAFAIAGLSLAGIPPFIGYWSKDSVLAASFGSENLFFVLSGTIGAFFTAVYIAKALGLLWRGQSEKPKIHKKQWMIVGMTLLLLVVLAAGLYLEPLVKTNGYELPKDVFSKTVGLSAAVIGLITGWFYRESWLSKRLIRFSSSNYSFAGGYYGLVARPVLKLADLFYRVDRIILSVVEGVGGTFLKGSKGAFLLDRGGKVLILGTADAVLSAGIVSKIFDAHILDRVNNLAENVRKSGGYGRKWQSGLVHKELAITIVTLLILILILTVSILQL